MDSLTHILGKVLTVIFAAGVIGCALVIPLTAFALFRVLFQPDTAEETAGEGGLRNPDDVSRVSPAEGKSIG